MRYYSNTGWCLYLGSHGARVIYMPEKEWMELNNQNTYNKPTIRPEELLNVFPQAKKILKELLKNDEAQMSSFLIKEREVNKKYNKLKDRDIKARVLYEEVFHPLIQLLKRINFRKKVLWAAQKRFTYKKFDVPKAKEVPIENFIQFNNSGRATCLWHEPDRNPSMNHYRKKNRVWCFSCSNGGDVIDVIMKLYNLDFKNAVSRLLK